MKKKVTLEGLRGLKLTSRGLSQVEFNEQMRIHGRNDIVEDAGSSFRELIQETSKDPMIWFLLIIGFVFSGLGEIREAAILFFAILPLLLMDAFLHWRTRTSTQSLRGQLSYWSRVIRDGQEIEVSSRDLVPGDLVLLSAPGDAFVPADGIFEATDSFQVDESMLTGESLPLNKLAYKGDLAELIDEEDIFVEPVHLGFAGTRGLTGKARLRVLATAKNTNYGEIVQSLIKVPRESTQLQKEISRLMRVLVVIAGLFCVLLAVVRLMQGHSWLDAFLSAATLAVAAIPEEFPVVFTFFLGVGIYRLAHRQILVRRAVSVENIGRITQICSDKTGTITFGQLKLIQTKPSAVIDFCELLRCAAVACDPKGFDPVDQAILSAVTEKKLNFPKREKVFPFTEVRKREGALAHDFDGKPYFFTKGSPEIILERSLLVGNQRQVWLAEVEAWAKKGQKILACARKRLSQGELEISREPDGDFEFLGLLGFEDPPRSGVAEAVEYCRQQKIRLLMITGDHPGTASSIASQVGIGGDHPIVISAQEHPEKFEESWLMSNQTFVRNIDVVARCNPLQKLNIVKALKRSGELVAVTGDGVNDVPALNAADIGIAMGLRGTRSAKEVASIIISDDNFKTIVAAIREGRQLFTNLKMSFEYLLLFHIPFVISAAFVPLLGYPLLYLPVHIVWLELIIHPTALFAFQQPVSDFDLAGERLQHRFFSRRDIVRIGFIGFVFSAAVTGLFIMGLAEGADVNHARAQVMALLLVWNTVLIVTLTRLKTLMSIVLIVLTLTSGALLIQHSSLSKIFHLTPLHWYDGALIIFFGGFFTLANVMLARCRSKRADSLALCFFNKFRF